MNVILGILVWFLIVIGIVILLFIFGIGALVICIVSSIFIPDKFSFKPKIK